ncbi:conserved hypothetical protein [Luminiphilus syltensis NOR5-1B]|uniref:Uncharacterized protein n=1 Tax=Luminiphilus syltensis NOR5-1B TaxID=565045 RepID=B8KUX4_9GAMM|nr:hypothetical protein [Luminiphilus syltensis]EED34502.1 conserved hypothetical protein [Luminiphilus syltensis NOR5-1B]
MDNLAYSTIFDAVTPDREDAADVELREDLTHLLRGIFEQRESAQLDASGRDGGKVDTLSSDKLIGYLAKL